MLRKKKFNFSILHLERQFCDILRAQKAIIIKIKINAKENPIFSVYLSLFHVTHAGSRKIPQSTKICAK